MTDPLDILFENLMEHLEENLPGTCWPLYQRARRLENALLAALTPEQIELLEAYQAAAWRMPCWPPCPRSRSNCWRPIRPPCGAM